MYKYHKKFNNDTRFNTRLHSTYEFSLFEDGCDLIALSEITNPMGSLCQYALSSQTLKRRNYYNRSCSKGLNSRRWRA